MDRRTTDRREWVVLVGCFLLSVGVNSFIIAPSSITPLFADRFDVTTALVGNLVSATFVGLILTQIPSGYLIDRFDNRWIVGPATLGFVLVVLALQGVDSFEELLVLRALGGVAVGLVFTTGANVVGQVVPAHRQGVATGIYLTSPPAAFAIAHVTGPLVGSAFGPLRVFLVHAIVSLLGLALFATAATEPIRNAGTPTLAEFTSALRNRAVILVSVSAFAAYALYLFLNTWLPAYGHEVLSLSLTDAGVVTALVPLVGIVARTGGGWVSGYLGGRRRPVLVVGLVAAVVCLGLIPLTDTLLLFILLSAGAGFTVQLGAGVYYVATREFASVGTEATSLTVLTTITFVGSFSGPLVGGWLIAAYSWTVSIFVFVCLGVVGVLALLPLSEPGA